MKRAGLGIALALLLAVAASRAETGASNKPDEPDEPDDGLDSVNEVDNLSDGQLGLWVWSRIQGYGNRGQNPLEWRGATYNYLKARVEADDDVSAADRIKLLKWLDDIGVRPVAVSLGGLYRFGLDTSDGREAVWDSVKTMWGLVGDAAFGEGGGPPEDWSEEDVDQGEDEGWSLELQKCEVRTWAHDSIWADPDLESPVTYGLTFAEWAKLAATWNAIVSDTHCWFVDETTVKALMTLPPMALWANLGTPPLHVRVAAAELYHARHGVWPEAWSAAETELAFVTAHLL